MTQPSSLYFEAIPVLFGAFFTNLLMTGQFLIIWVLLSLSYLLVLDSASCSPPQFLLQPNSKFEQKTNRFWEFREQSNSWVELELPYDLVSCVNGGCRKVGLIGGDHQEKQSGREHDSDGVGDDDDDDDDEPPLPVRKRVSLTKISETSIWVTGQSGSIYERFWNGVHWVFAPHDLPLSAGHAISVFIVNQTVLALSESGKLYQLQLSESSQPIWVCFAPALHKTKHKESEHDSTIQIKSGVVSHDRMRMYFCTKDGSLLELSEVEPPRWVDHGRPRGANVAAIAETATKSEALYTISSKGDLYEYDRSSKPSWKKHIWKERTAHDTSLMPSMGFASISLGEDHSISLFLLSKVGKLVERRLHQRKWKWIVHGSPRNKNLTSMTPVLQDELNDKTSLFLTSSVGSVYEYRIPTHSGSAQEHQKWVNHKHPLHAKAARSIPGKQFQFGRVLFHLDDGRLAELHQPGLGGEASGPTHQSYNSRRKSSTKYVWTVLQAPETEGWNAEYCTEERGPTNCITGIKDKPNDDLGAQRTVMRRRKVSQAHEDYIPTQTSGPMESQSQSQSQSKEEYIVPENWTNTNFRLRVMHPGRSFFLVTGGGFTFEYVYAESVWLWLRHEHETAMRGVVGSYNGSVFLVDTHGSLLIRERNGNDLAWINCTAMRKGRHVIAGPPWDRIPGRAPKVTPEDSLFTVSKSGRLLQFTVAMRKFRWKDCRNPPDTKVSCIVDQELFRDNIVFVMGRNRRLYQYNKVTGLWHEHYLSQHLILARLPGTAMRSSSLTGSIFVLSEDGGLVEYHWNRMDGWNWVEHGTPDRGVVLVGSPGLCFGGNELLLVGSDGNVYLRHMDQSRQMEWTWKNCGFPVMAEREVCGEEDKEAEYDKTCDSKVAPTRPIPFSDNSVIFELRDGRLAEMRRMEDSEWIWSRTIGTPTSQCNADFWTAWAA